MLAKIGQIKIADVRRDRGLSVAREKHRLSKIRVNPTVPALRDTGCRTEVQDDALRVEGVPACESRHRPAHGAPFIECGARESSNRDHDVQVRRSPLPASTISPTICWGVLVSASPSWPAMSISGWMATQSRVRVRVRVGATASTRIDQTGILIQGPGTITEFTVGLSFVTSTSPM